MGCETQSASSESCQKNVVESQTFHDEFSQRVCQAISEKRCESENVRVFSQDETRYGLLGPMRRCITRRGMKPIAKINPCYESVYLYAAVEPLTGERFFLEFSHLTSDCFQCFLEKFSEAFSESLNLLVLDNGRFHQAQSLKIPENVVLLFLPPDSPELNPIERLWQDLKAKLFTQTYKALEDMQAKISEILEGYCDAVVAKLTQSSHFINAAHAV